MCKQAKKFAKPELKLCIEEFEEKLTKFHMEKKEQEVTARNAQIHQQKIGGMEGCAVARNEGEVSEESDVFEGWYSNIYIYIFFFFGRGCLFQCLMSWNFPRASRFS
jgi:hypothetical protein